MSMVAVRPAARNINRPSRTFGRGIEAPGHAVQTIEIKGVAYAVEPLRGDEGEAIVRLVKQGDRGQSYDVVRDRDGRRWCHCPDFLFVRQDLGQQCKHIAAAEEAGLLDPRATPTDRATDEVLDLLEARGYGSIRLARVAEAIRRDPATAADSIAVDPRDRAEVRRLLDVAPIPAPGPRPVAPVSAPGPRPSRSAEVARKLATPPKPSKGDIWTDGKGDVDAMDAAWNQGFDLAREGIAAEPCREWATSTRLAFLQGRSWGEVARDADLRDEADEQDARAADWAEEQAWDEHCRRHHIDVHA